jgi:hypothetical protein
MRLLEVLLVGKPLQICITCTALTMDMRYLYSINYNVGAKSRTYDIQLLGIVKDSCK